MSSGIQGQDSDDDGGTEWGIGARAVEVLRLDSNIQCCEKCYIRIARSTCTKLNSHPCFTGHGSSPGFLLSNKLAFYPETDILFPPSQSNLNSIPTLIGIWNVVRFRFHFTSTSLTLSITN